MKKILVPLLLLELKTARLPLYAADDSFLNGLVKETEPELPVLVLPVRKSFQLQFAVGPEQSETRGSR